MEFFCTDFASRYLLTREALSTTREAYAFAVFERTFKDFGLPRAIRTDNGVPFASAHALYGQNPKWSGRLDSNQRSPAPKLDHGHFIWNQEVLFAHKCLIPFKAQVLVELVLRLLARQSFNRVT